MKKIFIFLTIIVATSLSQSAYSYPYSSSNATIYLSTLQITPDSGVSLTYTEGRTYTDAYYSDIAQFPTYGAGAISPNNQVWVWLYPESSALSYSVSDWGAANAASTVNDQTIQASADVATHTDQQPQYRELYAFAYALSSEDFYVQGSGDLRVNVTSTIEGQLVGPEDLSSTMAFLRIYVRHDGVWTSPDIQDNNEIYFNDTDPLPNPDGTFSFTKELFGTVTLAEGDTCKIMLADGSVNLIRHGTYTDLPEPATMLLLGLGLMGLAGVRRKFKK